MKTDWRVTRKIEKMTEKTENQIYPPWEKVKAWNNGIEIEDEAWSQIRNTASLDIVSGLRVMPDAHWGRGSTVGSVIATRGAVICAALGVDLGCGMAAVQTNIKASQLPDSLTELRHSLERDIPVGKQSHRGRFRLANAKLTEISAKLDDHMLAWETILEKVPDLKQRHHHYALQQCGSLGGGNHFVEICLDEDQNVWVMLHSGSRGIGNKIGNYFIEMAKEIAIKKERTLPDVDLAWLDDGTPEFDLYVQAFSWAQEFAKLNRAAMMELVLYNLSRRYPQMQLINEVISCHHNYASLEEHFGEKVWITRKGAVSAKQGELGIIPSAMGQPSFIVRGKGNPHSYCSCSHGAGRRMSRGKARKTFSNADLLAQTEGVECRKDDGVLDEIPGAYKDINQVIAAQSDLIEVVAKIKAVLCIKG